ncbi:MAG: DUF3006 domain-containing protein [Haloarculaceae archaeon]
MVDDGGYTAVLDRVEEDEAGAELAVLLVEAGDVQVDELVVERTALPEGAGPNSVLEIVVEHGRPIDATVDEDATERRTDAAQDRFDRLARRPPSDEDPEE